MSFFVSAIGFEDHALVMSFAGSFASQGTEIHRVDSRGNTVSSNVYPNIWAVNNWLVKSGDSSRLITLNDNGVQMHSLDRFGAPTQAPVVTLFSGRVFATPNSGSVVVTSTDNAIWLAWAGQSKPPRADWSLLVQGFSFTGSPISAAHAIAYKDSPAAWENLRASGAVGNAILTWIEPSPLGSIAKYVALRSANEPPLVRTLFETDNRLGADGAAFDGGLAAIWPTDTGTLAGVTFDPSGIPFRSNAGQLQTEVVPLPGVGDFRNTNFKLSTGSKIDLTFDTPRSEWPADDPSMAYGSTFFQPLCSVAELSPGNGALATTGSSRILFRGLCRASHMISLKNNVLLFLPPTIQSVWRRAN